MSENPPNSTAEKLRVLEWQKQYLLLKEKFNVGPSLASKFKRAADIGNVSAYVVAPTLLVFGMTTPGHSLAFPLLSIFGGIIAATVLPAVSTVLGSVHVLQAKAQEHFGQAKPGDGPEVISLREGFKHSQKQTCSNQAYSTAASLIAALAMSLSLAAALKHEGVNPTVWPVALISSIAGLYFGRKAHASSGEMAVFKAAITKAQPSIS